MGLVMPVGLVVSTMASAEVLDPNKDYEEARSGQRARPVATRPATTGVGSWFESKVAVAKTTVQSLARRWFGGGEETTKAVAPTAIPAVAANRIQAPVVPMSQQRAPANTSASPVAQVASDMMNIPGLTRSETGVVRYDIGGNVDAIPRLRLPREERFQDLKTQKFAVGGSLQKLLEGLSLAPLTSPTLTDEEEMRTLTKAPSLVQPARQFKELQVAKGKVDDTGLRTYALKLSAEPHRMPESLAKFTPLTDSEYRFLSGLLLYQQGYRCAAAVGLFHSISGKKEHQAEADYYLAKCSKSLGDRKSVV